MIKGLTDRTARLPHLGELRKGAEKKGNAPGKDLDYFRFTSKDEEAVRAFREHFGDEPRTINVMFGYPTAEENFEAWQEQWSAGGLVHRCDGETSVLWRDEKGRLQKTPKACPGGCKPVGRLSVVIPQLERMALVTVLTTSIHDILTIQQNLRAIELICNGLVGIPFLLTRVTRPISVPGDGGKRVRREKSLLSIEADGRWVTRQLVAMEQAALPPAPIPDEFAGQDDANGVDEIGGQVIDVPAGDVRQVQEEKPSGEIESLTTDQYKEIGELTEILIGLGMWGGRGDAANFLKGITSGKTTRGELNEAEARMVIDEIKKLRERKERELGEAKEKAQVTAGDIPF
jgi:hypothetical protein